MIAGGKNWHHKSGSFFLEVKVEIFSRDSFEKHTQHFWSCQLNEQSDLSGHCGVCMYAYLLSC